MHERAHRRCLALVWPAAIALLGSTCVPIDTSQFSDTTPPPLLGELTLSIEGCRRILMEWPDVDWPDPPAADESGLRFYRIFKNGLPLTSTRGTPVFEYGSSRHYVFEFTEPGESVTLGVTALDFAGNESPPLEASITMPAASDPLCRDREAPDPPTIRVTQQGTSACGRGVGFSMASTDHATVDPIFAPASGVAYFEVIRNGHFMGRVDAFYSQSVGQLPGESYAFAARAVDRAGNASEFTQALVHEMPEDCHLAQAPLAPVRVLVLPVFPADAPDPPSSVSDVYDFVRGGPTWPEHTVEDYFAETTYGRRPLVATPGSPDWIRLPLPAGDYCASTTGGGTPMNCNSVLITTHALQATGHDADDFDLFLLVESGMFDQRSGPMHVQIPFSTDARRAFVVALHELSHTIGGGVDHSGGEWSCPGLGAGEGFRHVTGRDATDLLFGCRPVAPQMDGYSPLGRATNSFHVPMFNKWLQGVLLPGETVFAPAGSSQVVIHAAELAAPGDVVRHVAVPAMTCTTDDRRLPLFSLEYRTLAGFDGDPLGLKTLPPLPIEGVQIRMVPWKGMRLGQAETLLLGTLSTGGPHFVFDDGLGSVEIEVLSADAQSAVVRIVRGPC